MRNKQRLALLLPLVLVIGAAALHQGQDKRALLPAVDNHARQPLELVDQRAFVLDEPFRHNWRSERPMFSGGFLLVLRADAEFLRPRQIAEPVLYVGGETAQRLNNPSESGYLICLVPAEVSQGLKVMLDPEATPIWFGTPELPERVDLARAQLELSKALALGVLPSGPIQRSVPGGLAPAQRSLAATTYMKNRDELDLIVADLLEQYSPAEHELIESLRMPLSR